MSTKEQLDKSFEMSTKKTYDCVILGNSRVVRGINPDKLSVSSFNFAHDNDSFNQIFYKLDYLERHGHSAYRYIIVGIDYFQFNFISDSRNYVYGNYFSEGYLKDYGTNIDDKFKSMMAIYIQQRFRPLMKFAMKSAFDRGTKEAKYYLKDNGQLVLDPPPKATSTDYIKRDMSRLKVQEVYFEKIVAYARTHNKVLILVMPPVRDVELRGYTAAQIEDFNNYINSKLDKSFRYFNYSKNSNFDMEDYTDITHLNPAAADKFTQILNKDIMPVISDTKAAANLVAHQLQ